MGAKRWMLAAAWGWLLLALPLAWAATPPALELVDVYHGDVDLSHYWVSEKFDGVRGYWDGHQLFTRGGQVIHVPAWFTRHWPQVPMDGELWAGYGQFSHAAAVVRTAGADDPAWHAITYHVFDLPGYGGTFDARVLAIVKTVAAISDPWVVAIRQFHVADDDALQVALKRVLDKGGEGLVLHRGDAPYRAGRGVGLLKVKPYEDAEARVLAIHPGHGRLKGLMGSIEVRTRNGRTFAIGTGFTDAERADPPPIGSWITYRFNGRTATGLPRFARFLRRRPSGPPPEAGKASADP
jgi:DNA ligase-1